MNHKITREYMLEGLQDRIDKLSYKLWNENYIAKELEREKAKKFNAKNYSLKHIHD